MTRARWPALAAALFGFGWFLRIGGLLTLDPTRIDWLLDADWSVHLLGWLMFRNEPWAFPLGKLSGALYPLGSTIGYTDSNPLVSVVLKPFSSFLPTDFQFIGPWLAMCFMLQGYFGAKLAGLTTTGPIQQWLAGCLFVLSPVLANRLGHDTLCAHWLLLALLYIGLREYPESRSLRRSIFFSIGLMMMAASIHPYLAAMGWVLALSFYSRAWRNRGMTMIGAAGWAAVATGALLLTFWLFGYLAKGAGTASGFGVYSADLLTLFNPMGFSRLLPTARLTAAQGEGVGFLGLGGLFACAIAIGVLIGRRLIPWRKAGSVVVACALMGLFALSSVVTAAGQPVLSLKVAYAPMEGLIAPFRASGRFIWPLHYLALSFGVWGCVRAFGARRHAAAMLLTVAVVLQVVDIRVSDASFAPRPFRQLRVEDWTLTSGHYQHLALVPMQVLDACMTPWQPERVRRYMLQAYRSKLTFNSGVFARVPVGQARVECWRVQHAVATGALDAATIYVVAPGLVARLRELGVTCGRLDRDWICVDRRADSAFRAYLEKRRTEVPAAIDLMQELPNAEKRPLAREKTFILKDETIAGRTEPAIYAQAPSRIVWEVTLPNQATLSTAIGIDPDAWDKDGDGVVFRIGVSDGVEYRELLVKHLDPHTNKDDRRWVPVILDLSAYSGQIMEVVFSTDTSPAGHREDSRHDLSYWAAPAIRQNNSARGK